MADLTPPPARRGIDPALLVILAGVAAALNVGKAPPAIPVLSVALGMTLVQAGFLLSLVQFAGMGFGIFAGLAADTLGLKRCMLTGLLTLALAGIGGGFANDATTLLVLRGVEGFGFLLAVMPGPGLIRQLVPRERVSPALGLWSAYMPLGIALSLLAGPLVLAPDTWPLWWWLIAAISLAAAAAIAWAVPGRAERGADSAPRPQAKQRLRQTLSARGPWLVAACFAVYAAQWMSVIGFLPTIYARAGVGATANGLLTALAAAVNIVGNVAAGRLLARGVRPQILLWTGFATMAFGALATFAEVDGTGLPPALRYVGVLLFSAVGGLIPGTLFSLAVSLAPNESTVSTTVGWMQQCSSIGQFIAPPLVALMAARAGGWQWTWMLTGGCALVGALLASPLGKRRR